MRSRLLAYWVLATILTTSTMMVGRAGTYLSQVATDTLPKVPNDPVIILLTVGMTFTNYPNSFPTFTEVGIW